MVMVHNRDSSHAHLKFKGKMPAEVVFAGALYSHYSNAHYTVTIYLDN